MWLSTSFFVLQIKKKLFSFILLANVANHYATPPTRARYVLRFCLSEPQADVLSKRMDGSIAGFGVKVSLDRLVLGWVTVCERVYHLGM